MVSAQEIGEKLMAWGSSENANNMWGRNASCIREAAREVLGSREVDWVNIERIGGGMDYSRKGRGI